MQSKKYPHMLAVSYFSIVWEHVNACIEIFLLLCDIFEQQFGCIDALVTFPYLTLNNSRITKKYPSGLQFPVHTFCSLWYLTERKEPKKIGSKAMTTRLLYATNIPSGVAGIFAVAFSAVPLKVSFITGNCTSLSAMLTL